MNKERRKQIEAARKMLESAQSILEEAKAELETARDEERDYYDNMPESLQGGEKGERASAAADALDEVVSSAEEIESALESMFANLDTAAE